MHSARTARPRPFKRTTIAADERNPIGRPSSYRPEYCEAVVTAMKTEGISLSAFAAIINADTTTVYDWIRAHSDFALAVKRARAQRLLFLERKLLKENNKDAIASIFALKNAAPDEWQDRRYVDQSVHVKADLLTTDQLRAIAAGHEPLLIEGTCERFPDASQEVEELPNPLISLEPAHDAKTQEPKKLKRVLVPRNPDYQKE